VHSQSITFINFKTKFVIRDFDTNVRLTVVNFNSDTRQIKVHYEYTQWSRKIAQSLMLGHSATVHHRITQFSPKAQK